MRIESITYSIKMNEHSDGMISSMAVIRWDTSIDIYSIAILYIYIYGHLPLSAL
jgi:hypothetical protein